MSAPLLSAEREFDLGDLPLIQRRERRAWVLAGALLGALFGGCGIFVVAIESAGGFSLRALVAGGWLWVFAGCVAYLMVRRRGLSLVKLSFCEASIHLFFANGTDQVLDMMDPKFGIALVDESRDPGALGFQRREVYLILADFPGRRITTVNHEILEAVVRLAQDNGIRVLTREEVYHGRGFHRSFVTRIGEPGNTPGWNQAQPANSG